VPTSVKLSTSLCGKKKLEGKQYEPTHQSYIPKTFGIKRHEPMLMPKLCQRVCLPQPQEEMQSIREHHIELNTSGKQFQNFLSPALRKKLKHPIAQPDTNRQVNTRTMTAKTQSYSNFQTWWTRTPAANSVLPQLAVTCKIKAECYYQTFVQVDSEELRNRQLRQHANRYGALKNALNY